MAITLNCIDITQASTKRSRSDPSKKAKKAAANLEACNTTAKEIFEKKAKEMQMEINKLKEELEQRKSQDGVITAGKPTCSSSSSSSESDDDFDDSLSAYEKAALKRKEENRQLLKTLGLLMVRN